MDGENPHSDKNQIAQGPKGDTGEPGPAPTDAQVMQAVTAYLTKNPPLPGVAGPSGRDGPPPTDAQVNAAVAAYLEKNPPHAVAAGDFGSAEFLTAARNLRQHLKPALQATGQYGDLARVMNDFICALLGEAAKENKG